MKRLVLTLLICLGCMGILGAQNVWKPINIPSGLLGAAPDGSLYFNCGYSGIGRSQDEGETLQIVLGYETGYDYYFNEYCFSVSPEGRIFVFEDNPFKVWYSDDNGDTWQFTSDIPLSAGDKAWNLYALNNGTILGSTEYGSVFWTTDGGTSWGVNDTFTSFEDYSISDVLANENGDVYIGLYYYGNGLYHSTLSDMQNWELVAFEGLGIRDMEFDPEGNVVCAGYGDEFSGFEYVTGFYALEANYISISDSGIVYTINYHDDDDTEGLAYSLDHGEHFTEIGERMYGVRPLPNCCVPMKWLIKGFDNHLYYIGVDHNYKSVRNADHILDYDYFPLVHEGNDRQKWNVVFIEANANYPNDYFTEIQSIRDDITLDGVDYKLVWRESVEQSKRIAGAVREEGKRVYYRMYWQQSFQSEVLLYDFNLTVGDTVSVGWSDYQLMVLEESEVEVNGTMRRQLGLAEYFIGSPYPPSEVEEYWIEGVGSTYGFLNSGYEGWVGAFVHLLCYHENGNLVWDNEEFDDCVMNSDGTPATFAPQGAEWYFDVFNPWGTHPEYQRFFVDGDTVIQGHQCSIIDQHFIDTGHDGGEFVYEEDNKVYWFNPTTNAFSTLYDFDAEAGESWDYEVGDCTHQVTVDSVGSTTWLGHTYRTQWVSYYEDPWVGSSGKGKIIEGVGYEKGLFPSIEVCNGWEVFDASEIEYLRCYVNDGEMLYHEGGYDCEQTTITPPSHPEWYYEILNDDGSITYQYMYQAGDTLIQDEPTHILVKINTLYDKGMREEVTHEYVFELNGKLYWWNKRTHSFTVLYDYEAEVGDSWNIMVGIEPPLTMTVDAVDYIEYEGRTYRVMHVSDPDNLFSGDIICGIGHQTSFFPERLMDNGDGMRVEGLRCYWVEDELVYNPNGEDCDAIYSDLHGIEEGDPSTGSGTFTIYPNPTNDLLNVRLPQCDSPTGYSITNLMGQTIMTGQITGETQRIDVSALPKGMYFITVGEVTRKFVVNR